VVTAEDGLAPEGAEIVPESELGAVDLICVLGGDGTMLRASRVVGDTGIPVLGINLGQLGFLAGFAPDEAEIGLAGALAGTVRIEDRTRLAVTLLRESGERIERTALNDAVIHQGAVARIVDVAAYIDDDFVASYRADGLIVSTPTGSTAYSLSARGPIVSPKHRALLVTPVAPHMLFDRSLVLDPSETVEIEVIGDREAATAVDGRLVCNIPQRAFVRCTPSESTADFIRFRGRHYHQVLKAKFGLTDR
jgi:NAD+ kinase